MTDEIDLSSGEKPWEFQIILECKGCGVQAGPVRRYTDPNTIVRCRECGKRHHRDSLEAK